jgi:hypothetical protein
MSRPSPVVDGARADRFVYAAGPLGVTVAAGLGHARLALLLGALATATGLLLPVVRARRVEELVTPVADPRDDAGRLLRPITITIQDLV